MSDTKARFVCRMVCTPPHALCAAALQDVYRVSTLGFRGEAGTRTFPAMAVPFVSARVSFSSRFTDTSLTASVRGWPRSLSFPHPSSQCTSSLRRANSWYCVQWAQPSPFPIPYSHTAACVHTGHRHQDGGRGGGCEDCVAGGCQRGSPHTCGSHHRCGMPCEAQKMHAWTDVAACCPQAHWSRCGTCSNAFQCG